ncbi:unnamed protein product [Pedinophyceae sp. YPF-701]|nr:unnamed protein product [Pedinophyceae sp. YPF-701]
MMHSEAAAMGAQDARGHVQAAAKGAATASSALPSRAPPAPPGARPPSHPAGGSAHARSEFVSDAQLESAVTRLGTSSRHSQHSGDSRASSLRGPGGLLPLVKSSIDQLLRGVKEFKTLGGRTDARANHRRGMFAALVLLTGEAIAEAEREFEAQGGKTMDARVGAQELSTFQVKYVEVAGMFRDFCGGALPVDVVGNDGAIPGSGSTPSPARAGQLHLDKPRALTPQDHCSIERFFSGQVDTSHAPSPIGTDPASGSPLTSPRSPGTSGAERAQGADATTIAVQQLWQRTGRRAGPLAQPRRPDVKAGAALTMVEAAASAMRGGGGVSGSAGFDAGGGRGPLLASGRRRWGGGDARGGGGGRRSVCIRGHGQRRTCGETSARRG